MKYATNDYLRGLFCVFCTCFLHHVVLAVPPDGAGYGWKLIFHDEFEGTSVDSSKWITQLPWTRAFKGDAYFHDNNVTVNDGILTITAKAESFGGRPFTSGAISTGYNRFRFKYGYAEARLKLPKARGSWANFWMLDDGWPPEIDVMENPTNNETTHNQRFYTNYHYHGSGGNASWGGWVTPGFDLSQSFNIYGMEWRPGYMGFRFNDSLTRQSSGGHFDQPHSMYLIFDYYVGGEWGSEVWLHPDPATWPAPETGKPLYHIDWVRVWQRIRDTNPECIGHWRLDGTSGTTAIDSSGKGMHGALMGGQTFDADSVDGVVGRALRFDGVDDYIALPAGFNEFDNGFSVTFWAHPTAVTNWARFIDLGNGPGNNNIVLAREGQTNTLIFQTFGGTSGGGYVRATDAIDLNAWQFFAATIDTSGAVTLYKNGQVVGTGTSTWPWGVQRLQNYVGRSNWAGDAYYQGYMDDIRIFDYALSEEEVLSYFQTETAQPFNGLASPIPGRIEAEHFDLGHEGIGYHDATGGNSGGAFRLYEDVDIRAISDLGVSNYAVTDISAGEWLRYTVHVTETADYYLYVRASATDDDIPVVFKVNDEVVGTATIGSTGSVNTFRTFVLGNVELTEGEPQALVMAFPATSSLNINWIQFEKAGPWAGEAPTIPDRIQAEEYDFGGSGVAYYDTTIGNTSGPFRSYEDVDVVGITDGVAGYAIDTIATGEWVVYTVNSAAAETDVFARVASTQAGGQIRVWLDEDLLATIDVPNTGSLTTWETASAPCLPLPERENAKLKLEFAGTGFRVHWIQFGSQMPYPGAPSAIPGRLEFEDFDIGGQFISYYDKSPTNGYGQYRLDEAVDIQMVFDGGLGFAVYAEATEWLEYTCDIEAGTYTITVRSASPRTGGQELAMSVDGQTRATFMLPNTGGWGTWRSTAVSGVYLPGGERVIRFAMLTSDCNLNYVDFVRETNPADITQSGRVDLDDFAVLAAQWLGAPGVPSADIAPAGGDGEINLPDLLLMAENWLMH